MRHKALTIVVALALLSVIAFGISYASPNQQTAVPPLDFLIAVLEDADAKGALSPADADLISNWVIENQIAPNSGETPQQARTRLSVQEQTSLQFLVAALRDAESMDAFPNSTADILSNWVIENQIAPNSGETPQQIRSRLSTPTPTPSPTPIPPTVCRILGICTPTPGPTPIPPSLCKILDICTPTPVPTPIPPSLCDVLGICTPTPTPTLTVTPTPTPTLTVTPTPTPTLTATPTPTPTLTPTPTPIPPALCNNLGICTPTPTPIPTSP